MCTPKVPNAPKVLSAPNSVTRTSVSPYRTPRSKCFEDLTDECILAILSRMSLLDLVKMSQVCVFLRAMVSDVFENQHGGALDFCSDQFLCKSRVEFKKVLRHFGADCRVITLDMDSFEDDFDAAEAFQLLSDHCGNKVNTLLLMNFHLDLQMDENANTTTFMEKIERLVMVKCSLANSAILFEAAKHALEGVHLEQTEFDAVTSGGFQELVELRELVITGSNLIDFELDKLVQSNQRLERLHSMDGEAVPLPEEGMPPIKNLSYALKSNFMGNNTDVIFDRIANLEQLEIFELYGNKRLDIGPLLDRFAGHQKLKAIRLHSMPVNAVIVDKLKNIPHLKSLTLDKVMSIDQQHKLMSRFNRMAVNGLNELTIIFKNPVLVDNLAFRFIIMANMSTSNVNRVDSHEDACNWVANIDQTKLDEPNVIAVWSNGILWHKFDVDENVIVIEDD